MSITSDFWKAMNNSGTKVSGGSGSSSQKSSSGSSSGGSFIAPTSTKKKKSISEEFWEAIGDDDIAPVSSVASRVQARSTGGRFNADLAPVSKSSGRKKDKEKGKLFQKGLFEDGYNIGDITKTILGTAGDVAIGAVKGFTSGVEGIVDLGSYGVAGVLDAVGKDNDADRLRKVIAESQTDQLWGGLESTAEKYSVLGDKVDSVIDPITQALGYIGMMYATAGIGAAAGVSGTGATALSTGTMFASSAGGSMGEAYQGGATDEEAFKHGVMKGAVDAGSELIFGGLGKAAKTLGLSRGLSSLDDIFAKKLSDKISNHFWKSAVQYGVKASAEGVEEVLAGLGSAVSKKLTYMSDEDLNKLIEDENLLEQFAVGTAASAIMQSGFVPGTSEGSIKESITTGRDFISGLSQSEQKVVDKLYQDEIASREKNGKVTQKEKDKIYDSILEDMEKGYISTDTIEEVLGGESYSAYKKTVDTEDAILKEYDELGEKQNATPKDYARYTELTEKVKNIHSNSQRKALRAKLNEDVMGLVQGSRLAESYNERARTGQKFEADVTKYNAKQQAVVQKAIDSGILNNSNRTHEFVDFVSKISADTGVLFDFSNTQKLREAGYVMEGQTIDGFYNPKEGITVNIDSPKSRQFVVGHEITHALEGSELYDALRKSVFDYAKMKNQYDSRMESIQKRYKEGTDFEAELTADLVGEYIFSDTDFVKHLSTQNRNVFQKVYDEIKYLYKVATAGSKEARELEKVKRAFEKAYREGGKTQGETKYSVSDKNIKDISTGYSHGESYYTMSYMQDGKVVATLEYGEYDGEANVKMIEVEPEYRRKGIATKLLQELQNKYEGTEIDFGMSTPDGTKLLESITYDVTDEAVVADRQKFKDLQSELNDLQEKLDVLYDTENLTEEQDAELHNLGDRWQEVYESIHELSENLRGKKATRTFVKTDVKYSLSDSDGKQLTKEQQEYFKDSKARDENGNLIKVYHSSPTAGFTVFDGSEGEGNYKYGDYGDGITFFTDNKAMADSYSPSSEKVDTTKLNTLEEATEWLESLGFTDLDIKEKNGQYKIIDYDEGRVMDFESEEHLLRDLKRTIQEEYGDTHAGGQYEGYLHMKNPMVVDAEGRPWDRAFEGFSQELYDQMREEFTEEEKAALIDLAGWEDFGVFKDEVQRAVRDVGKPTADDYTRILASAFWKCSDFNALFDMAADGFSDESIRRNAIVSKTTNDIVEEALQDGSYDGVIIKNVIDYGGHAHATLNSPPGNDYIVFNSNQFKAADNLKPTDDADIRYSLSDNDYLDAVNRGDMEAAQQMVNAAAKAAGYSDNMSWKMQHTAPNSKDDISLVALKDSGLVPKDYWDHPEWYTYGAEERESFYKVKDAIRRHELRVAKGKDYMPTMIWVYRAVDKTVNARESTFRNGDWVTPSRAYAENEGQMNPKGYRIIKDLVPIKDLYWDGNSIAELGYDDGNSYAYADTKNNRKLLDPVTYDDAGNVIPLSKRFKKRVDDTRYSLSDAGEQHTSDSLSALRYDAPVAENATTPIVAENATVQQKTQLTEENATVTAADMQSLFPDDAVPVQEELEQLVTERDQLFKALEIAVDRGSAAEVGKLAEEYEALNARIKALESEDSERIGSLTDAPPEMDAPFYGESEDAPVDDPFEDRDWYKIGNQKVKAYMYENPEVKPFFQAEAQNLLGELSDTQKGERWYNDDLYYESGGEQGFGGQKRLTSDSIATLLDYWGMSYADIEKGLNAIIEDNGAENIAAAKKIEFMLNDRLLNGYKDFYTNGRIEPNQDYINLLNEKQINSYSKEAFDSFMANADQYAPLAEDVAPVKQTAPDTIDAPIYDDNGQSAMFAPVQEERRGTRKEYHQGIIDNIKSMFKGRGFDFDKVLKNAKNLSTWSTVDNTPQRVMEKALGYKEGGILADMTVNKVAQNETEGIKWLNSYVKQLKQISKQYGIKPGSKESAAAQMFAEGFFVNEKNEIVRYGEPELIQDFGDADVRRRIKALARDPRIRKIYDDTLASINESRVRNLYPEIPRLDNYFLHFRAMEDTFSTLGLPFNPNDIRAKDLPTDLNGVTADLKPGQPFFSSAMHRTGKRTSFDLLGGVERYLNSAKNQIYHIDDIQTLRALRNYIAETYGQATGLEDIDSLTDAEAEERIKQVYDSHLSTFAKFLNEEANVLAGKTALIDRGIEGIIGRRGITFLNALNKQVGSNMVGYNVSSSLTNFLPVAQTFAKTNKFDFTKAFAQTVANKLSGGRFDSFAEDSPVVIRRKGEDRFYRTPWQKMADPGYALMGMVDDISTEIIARTKYNEFIRKGMDSQKAHFETDKWVSKLMGDRSLGQQPQLYNSKMLGLVTKFQLEVRNQLDSQFYDTIQETKASNEHIQNGLARNAKTAAKVTSVFAQLAVAQHLYGMAFESIAGYNPAFDIIEVLMTAFGFDDEEDSEDTLKDNLGQGFEAFMEDLPYASIITGGGRIPISSALPIKEFFKGEDQYGNEKSRWETLGEVAPYYLMPGGYGQVKKTTQGLKMFSDDHPIAGSYTDSGNLRYDVEDTVGSRIKAGIFGQYASENAQKYFNQEQRTLNPEQTEIFAGLNIPIEEYWEYRDNLYEFYDVRDALKEAAYADGATDEDVLRYTYINNIYGDIYDLYDKQKKLASGNSKGKTLELKQLQKQMEQMLSDSKYGVDSMKLTGAYAEVGGVRYNKDADSGRWYEIKPKNADGSDNWYYQKEQEVTKGLGVSYEEYWNNREEYNFAYDKPGKYAIAKAVGGYDSYMEHYDALENWQSDNYLGADKDSKGNSISGSRKKKVVEYINGLDMDYGERLILYRTVYSSKADKRAYNQDIIDYLNEREDISYQQMKSILEELDMEVDSNGNITW